ncbi:hypothetical protein F4678DRAFT_416527 [Xylaria arbuscula]|nr:hypothetical protein F4678DRAFT_416527 [Xylaria arbuscula]
MSIQPIEADIVAANQYFISSFCSAPQNRNTENSDFAKLADAPPEILRAILIALCKDPYQKRKAMSYFTKLEALESKQRQAVGTSTSTSTDETSNGSGSSSADRPNKRRAESELAICTNCKEPFSSDDNPSDACRYHPGDMEENPESSLWDDWEDWREGDPDSEEYKEEYPEGYFWDCCDQPGDSVGCARAPHEGLYKKA